MVKHRRSRRIIDSSLEVSPIDSDYEINGGFDDFEILRDVFVDDKKTTDKINLVLEFRNGEMPAIDTLLQSDIQMREKARILELYNVFLSMDVMTLEFLGVVEQPLQPTQQLLYNVHRCLRA